MSDIFIEPWFPPLEPDLARLAMEAADAAGARELRAWPGISKGGVAFQDLPIFLPWRGQEGGRQHLVLVQPREVGALVPGARPNPMPKGWLEQLDLAELARPLARHPDLGGAAHVHVVGLLAPGLATVRSLGQPAPELVAAVLVRITGVGSWRLGQH